LSNLPAANKSILPRSVSFFPAESPCQAFVSELRDSAVANCFEFIKSYTLLPQSPCRRTLPEEGDSVGKKMQA